MRALADPWPFSLRLDVAARGAGLIPAVPGRAPARHRWQWRERPGGRRAAGGRGQDRTRPARHPARRPKPAQAQRPARQRARRRHPRPPTRRPPLSSAPEPACRVLLSADAAVARRPAGQAGRHRLRAGVERAGRSGAAHAPGAAQRQRPGAPAGHVHADGAVRPQGRGGWPGARPHRGQGGRRTAGPGTVAGQGHPAGRAEPERGSGRRAGEPEPVAAGGRGPAHPGRLALEQAAAGGRAQGPRRVAGGHHAHRRRGRRRRPRPPGRQRPGPARPTIRWPACASRGWTWT